MSDEIRCGELHWVTLKDGRVVKAIATVRFGGKDIIPPEQIIARSKIEERP